MKRKTQSDHIPRINWSTNRRGNVYVQGNTCGTLFTFFFTSSIPRSSRELLFMDPSEINCFERRMKVMPGEGQSIFQQSYRDFLWISSNLSNIVSREISYFCFVSMNKLFLHILIYSFFFFFQNRDSQGRINHWHKIGKSINCTLYLILSLSMIQLLNIYSRIRSIHTAVFNFISVNIHFPTFWLNNSVMMFNWAV